MSCVGPMPVGTSTTSRSSSKSFACAMTFPGVEHDAVAVEDQFVVSAHLVHIDQRLAEPADLRGEQFQAEVVLADDERASAGVDQNLCAGGVQIGDRVLVIQPAGDQLLVVPQIFADRQARRSMVADSDKVLGLVRAGPGSK